jgi:hypothetical protein
MAVEWATVLFASLGSIGGGAIVLAGAFVAWGRLTQRVTNLEQHQACSNGKLDKNNEKDGEIISRLQGVESRCVERETAFAKNNQAHVEIFGRLHALEIGLASLPGQMSDRMNKDLKEFRKDLAKDIRNVVLEFFESKDHSK